MSTLMIYGLNDPANRMSYVMLYWDDVRIRYQISDIFAINVQENINYFDTRSNHESVWIQQRDRPEEEILGETIGFLRDRILTDLRPMRSPSLGAYLNQTGLSEAHRAAIKNIIDGAEDYYEIQISLPLDEEFHMGRHGHLRYLFNQPVGII